MYTIGNDSQSGAWEVVRFRPVAIIARRENPGSVSTSPEALGTASVFMIYQFEVLENAWECTGAGAIMTTLFFPFAGPDVRELSKQTTANRGRSCTVLPPSPPVQKMFTFGFEMQHGLTCTRRDCIAIRNSISMVDTIA